MSAPSRQWHDLLEWESLVWTPRAQAERRDHASRLTEESPHASVTEESVCWEPNAPNFDEGEDMNLNGDEEPHVDEPQAVTADAWGIPEAWSRDEWA